MTRFAFSILLAAALAAPVDGMKPPAGSLEETARQVRKEILTLPNYGLFDNIRFTIEGDTVLLTGYASRPTLKSSAANVVKDIPGVERVRNQIEVLPLSRFDDEVRARAYVAIYGDPALARYNPNRGVPLMMSPARIAVGITNDPPPGNHPIRIIVNNGHVTLAGVVDSPVDRQVAEARVNNVFGAMSVSNELEVVRSK
ncbi:MAG TPA: BON domain-containing protein [Bryobacteraceae bacterium]|nr:transporter [Bryobacterales bacterium]HRJ20639.1 BON domain-containing protein [Bryobacteraceae bacterium]